VPVRPPNYVFDASLVPKTWLKFLSSSQIHLALWFTPFWGPRPPQIRAATYRTALSNAPRYSCFISRSRQKARPDIDRYFLMATAGSVGGCNGPRQRSAVLTPGQISLRITGYSPLCSASTRRSQRKFARRSLRRDEGTGVTTTRFDSGIGVGASEGHGPMPSDATCWS